MSNPEASKVLYSLSKTDAEIQATAVRKSEIQERHDTAQKDINRLKAEIDESQARYEQLKSRQELEEERLRNEERKIVERRKQLTALGGTKGAKLVEREIDIAARTLQTMEQRVVQALEEVEGLGTKVTEMKKDLEERQLAAETAAAEDEQTLTAVNSRLSELEGRRDEAVSQLEERVRTLYLRVRGKYPGGAIARAEGGSCRSCYRALPAQLYNQVLSGNLLQCPGCSRILVTIAPEEQ